MNRCRLLTFIGLAVAMLALPWGMDRAYAGDGGAAGRAALAARGETAAVTDTWYANSPQPDPINGLPAFNSGTPIRKFVTRLPGLGAANANEIGQYIPVATPMGPAFPGDTADYYQIGLVQYNQRLHPDLAKATTLRGYKDLNPAAPANPNANYHLGPVIIAQKGKPVRILFKNQLSAGVGGHLFVPVDPTIMGAGIGPDGIHSYSQNRADIHLHGGFTPWISDGTPHQWVTPPRRGGPLLSQADQSLQ